MDTETASELSLLTRHQVEARCAISRSEIYKLMERSAFPRPVRIGRAVRWRSDDIAEWMSSLPKDDDVGTG